MCEELCCGNGETAMVLGGAFNPVGRNNKWFYFDAFGVRIATCGCFIVVLPETNGRTLSDTMDKEENKDIKFVCYF